jgi:hypothetical protein
VPILEANTVSDLKVSDALEALLEKVRALPPMTPRQREEQALDWTYGNLACSTNHKPARLAFAKVALSRGWTPEGFEAWAADKEWWDR